MHSISFEMDGWKIKFEPILSIEIKTLLTLPDGRVRDPPRFLNSNYKSNYYTKLATGIELRNFKYVRASHIERFQPYIKPPHDIVHEIVLNQHYTIFTLK